MSYAFNTPGEPEKLDFIAIHKSAAAVARQQYLEKYGVDKNADPEWKIGGERHKFWLKAFDDRQASLILNPHQD